MIFEMEYWKDRLQAAKTQEDFAQLLKELPENPMGLAIKNEREDSVMEHYQALKRFRVEDWYARLNLASTQQEFAGLLDEIPKPGLYALHEILNSRKRLVFGCDN